jgi:signal transduction histidine kinase
VPPEPQSVPQAELASIEELLRAWEVAMEFGLPLARTIIERHGGVISAESGAGSGTVFRVSLPLRSYR